MAAIAFIYSNKLDLSLDKDDFSKALTVKTKARNEVFGALRTDLQDLFVSGQYSDVTVKIPSVVDGNDTLVKAHRFLLCVRSEYFKALLTSGYADSLLPTITLPSDIFSPKSLGYIMTFIYTGQTLSLDKEQDLSTLLKVAEGADFLQMNGFYEIVLEIVCKLCHGFICLCSSCKMHYVPVLKFAEKREVQWLQELAMWPLIEAFGDTWDAYVAKLDTDQRDKICLGIIKRLERNEIISVMKGWQDANAKFGAANGDWAIQIRSMLDLIESGVKTVFQVKPLDVLQSKEFQELIDGIGFSQDLLEISLSVLVDTLTERWAPMIYQVLIGEYYLREEEPVGPEVAALINQARDSIMLYLKKRWVTAKGLNAFVGLQTWAAKEIADELDLQLKDLYQIDAAPTSNASSAASSTRSSSTAATKRPEPSKLDDEKPRSLRASVLNRNAAKSVSLGRPTKASLLRAQVTGNGGGKGPSFSSGAGTTAKSMTTLSSGYKSISSNSGGMSSRSASSNVTVVNNMSIVAYPEVSRSKSEAKLVKKDGEGSRPAKKEGDGAKKEVPKLNKSNVTRPIMGAKSNGSSSRSKSASSNGSNEGRGALKSPSSSGNEGRGGLKAPNGSNGNGIQSRGKSPNALLRQEDNTPILQLVASPPAVLFWYKEGTKINVARGKLRFIGRVVGSAFLQAGIELSPGNEHANIIDGQVDGKKYFTVENVDVPTGRFVPAHHVTLERAGDAARQALLEEARAARLRRFDDRMRPCPGYKWRPAVGAL